MELAAFERVPPGRGEIEVALTASSVNFPDVLHATGRYPGVDGDAPELGMDFAGVVTAVGPDVTTHRVGDHVGGFSKNGCWATHVTCDARLAVALPPGLTDDQAAAVSTAHAIAWYGLHDQARIATGDRVLIHSATGGVGQAAIAIARAAGAEIFATAGSESRRALLRNKGIEHVYDSRSAQFAEQIRRDTDGYGVDIVLNSLTGAAQRAGLDVLSVGGRFVEIGRRDVYANTRLELFPFHRNLTFHYVDLHLMTQSHPKRVGDLLATVYRLVADGELPVPESIHYPFGDAVTAVRAMSAAEHTGKLVLDVPQSGHTPVVVPPEQVRAFRRDGSYIVTGGLGGIGLFLAETMAAAGCGRIVLSSRSAAQPQGVGDDRAHPDDGHRHRGGMRRHRRRRDGDAAGERGDSHRASVARGAACRCGLRERDAGHHDRRAHRPQLGSKSQRRVELTSGHRRSSFGLVLPVFVGGRPGGVAGTGGVRRGQQLAGRIRAVAPDPRPSRHGDRVGAVGGGRSRRRNPGRDRGGVGARTGRRRHRNRALA